MRIVPVATCALVLACVEAGTVPPTTLFSLSVTPHTVTLLAVDDTIRFTATVRDQHGQKVVGGTVAWTSSDPSVANVDGSGLVRAVANGTTTISAASDGATGMASVSVAQVAASVSVSPGTLQFASLGESARLTGAVVDGNNHAVAGAVLAWASENPSIATVDTSGLVRPVANGSVFIHATSGRFRNSANVTVAQVAASLQLSSPVDSVLVSDSLRLTAQAFDAADFTIAEASFEWESSDPDIAIVDQQGRVVGVSTGSVVITASLGEASASVLLVIVPYPEELVLRVFYDATNGDLWQFNTNWFSDEPLAVWEGIHLNEEGRVIHIVLPGNGLIGAIPPQIRHLEHLESLHLGENDLAGPIPVEVTMLPRLRSLDLNYNGFTGTLPPEIGNLSELVALSLFGNELTGAIPPEIGKLTQLEYLDLCYNQLNGSIPAEIGNLREMKYLFLCGVDAAPHEGNRLSGEIPATIGNLTQLRILELSANQLTGPIPPEIGKLTQLDSLHLYSNLLTGLPPEIGGLTNVQSMILYGNRLTGPIPSTIGNLTRLTKLNFGIGFTSGNNLLTGSIPQSIGNLTNLRELDLGGSRLTGHLPRSIGNLTRLRGLELGTNYLTGPIPNEIGNLTDLERFAACPDSLQGAIPAEIGRLSKLRQLHLCRNRFTGTVPEELGNLTSLEQLNLWNNQLTGEMPGTLVGLGRLLEINWVNNDGLCAPLTPAFRDWLAGLRKWFGEYCAEEAAGSRWRTGGDGAGPRGEAGGEAGLDADGGQCWVTVPGRNRVVQGAGSAGVERRAVPCRVGAGSRNQ